MRTTQVVAEGSRRTGVGQTRRSHQNPVRTRSGGVDALPDAEETAGGFPALIPREHR
ncbi:hypothetical protein [Streptomyces albipurpureus]|uniref:Uncharacterized protein n=1 Tax=Streptomyces albipurpureus TaxID=2897419 RepID=A0ABT0UNL3_9ACTN|nr:hypothetical protein [Streptomyces sp. CWNU-1]MCM2389927.1 hypothetical protein [Streptomyces sp. CWNU-1]